ncbi:MAG: YjiH family protein, partial [Peptostreptococcaceae bacterium]
ITNFIIPSIVGIILFLLPLNYGGKINIGIGYLADLFKANFGEYLPAFMTIVVVLSTVLSLISVTFKPKVIMNNEFLKESLYIKPLWISFRIIGSIFILSTFFKIGPEFMNSSLTGGTLLFDLMPTLATWFLLSGFFLPLLLNYGIMDFFGTLIKNIMRPLFLVPGRSAIDAIASWIGSGPVGIVLTNQQLQEGYYTKKESAIISSCFSLVSLPFATVVASFLNISHLFLPFYLTISIASFIAAIVLPRIYPLNKISDEYMTKCKINEDVPENMSVLGYAFKAGVDKANSNNSYMDIIKNGLKIVIDVYINLMPMVMCFGTLGLIITEYTPIFTILSYPAIPFLELLNVPEASKAAPAILVGFADMFLPSVLASSIESEMTRFIIGALSFTQLIYMTETGVIILKSDIPLNIKDLFVIFIERTIVTLPIITLIANLIF